MIRARVTFRYAVVTRGKPTGEDGNFAIGDDFVLAQSEWRVPVITVVNGLGERLSWEYPDPALIHDLAKLLDQARDAVVAAGVEQRDQDDLIHRLEVCS